MNIHIISPFAPDKNLGRAYNETIKHLPGEDWICVMDYDAMFLLPEQINRMYEYVKAYPDTDVFTCYGSRNKDGVPQQYRAGSLENVTDIKDNMRVAKERMAYGLVGTYIQRSIAGFLMLFSKATWEKYKFDEGRKCLTVDTNFSKRILRAGGKILLMESLYVWHTYRLIEGKKSIKHLL